VSPQTADHLRRHHTVCEVARRPEHERGSRLADLAHELDDHSPDRFY
jgi:hypothetical protein